MPDTAAFAAGLLNPDHPVPNLVKGQITRRYAVYRNNVTMGLIRALEVNFPAVRRLLGEVYFFGFAHDFAQSYPPRSPLMFKYGADFSHALERSEDLASYPYLVDVARLEILWRQSYHAMDAKPLAPDALAALDPEALFDCRFVSHPAMRLLASPYAVHAIFAANRSTGTERVIRSDAAQYVLITRPEFEVSVSQISKAQFALFTALSKSRSLSDALDLAAAEDHNFDFSATLALLLQSGAFQSIKTKNG